MLNIKEIRTQLKISQESLATMLGVSSRTVQNWEKGGVIPETTKRAIESLVSNIIIGRNNKQFNGNIEGIGNIEKIVNDICPDDVRRISELEKEVAQLKEMLGEVKQQKKEKAAELAALRKDYDVRISELKAHMIEKDERIKELKDRIEELKSK